MLTRSIVDSGYRGVIYNRIGGIQNKVIPEGTHFLVPWFQRVYKYDIRTQPRTMSSLTGTRGKNDLFLSSSTRSADGQYFPESSVSPRCGSASQHLQGAWSQYVDD